jgi:hypothetical protein
MGFELLEQNPPHLKSAGQFNEDYILQEMFI